MNKHTLISYLDAEPPRWGPACGGGGGETRKKTVLSLLTLGSGAQLVLPRPLTSGQNGPPFLLSLCVPGSQCGGMGGNPHYLLPQKHNLNSKWTSLLYHNRNHLKLKCHTKDKERPMNRSKLKLLQLFNGCIEKLRKLLLREM